MSKIAASRPSRVPDAHSIARFRTRPSVWLTFAGAAVYALYMERLGQLQLKPNWITAMALIEQHPDITQSALGRELRINRASSMAICTLMEQAGVVARTPLRGRNQTGLTLTELGSRRLQEACDIETALTDQVLADFDSSSRNTLVEMLQTITDRAANISA